MFLFQILIQRAAVVGNSESSNCDSSREVREMATSQEIIRAALALDLSYLVQSLSDKLPSVDIAELLEEYKKFLAIKVIAKDATAPIHLSPSALIDQVWHQHLLHTAQYRAACSALGVFIDHDPEGALSSDSVRKNRLLLATTHYSIIFNQPAPVKFWGLEYEPDMDAETNMKEGGGQKKRLVGINFIFLNSPFPPPQEWKQLDSSRKRRTWRTETDQVRRREGHETDCTLCW